MTDRRNSRAATHADDCWSWGPGHYDCAVREIERLRGALEECHALSVARWQRLLAAEAENERLRKELAAAAEQPAPTEADVLAAAKRAAAANSSIHEGYDLELFWSYLDERAQAHWLKVARAVLFTGRPRTRARCAQAAVPRG